MLTTLATFDFPYEAQIARSKLDAAGIPAFLADEHTINANWLYCQALGGVRLQVPATALAEAEAILNGDSYDLPELEAVDEAWTCEVCGSQSTQYRLAGKPWAFLMFLLVEFPIWPVEDTRKCNDCGHIQHAHGK